MKQLLKQETGFAQIKNEVLNDENLSLKAKGLFSYIYSKPNNWDFSADRITLDSTDEIRSVRSAIKELEDNGYLNRRRLATGRVIYHIHYDKMPQCRSVTLTKCHSDKKDTVSNKDLKQIKIKKEINNFREEDKILTEMLYSKVNQNYPELADKRTEKQKISDYEELNRLSRIDEWSDEQITYIINWSQNDDFWKMNIRSVKKLRKKFDDLVVRAKNNQNKINVKI